jgi:hypothetical protein
MSDNQAERAGDFWDTYFSGGFVSLNRSPDGDFQGMRINAEDTEEFGLFPEIEPFQISRVDLDAFDYSLDERFGAAGFPTLAAALKHVLADGALAEETIPNRDRISLILRLLRDPEPAFTGRMELPLHEILRQFVERRLTARETIARLHTRADESDGDFDLFCGMILERLAAESLSTEQAADWMQGDGRSGIVPLAGRIGMISEILSKSTVTIGKACGFLKSLLPDEKDYARMKQGGLLSAVRTERDLLIQALALCPADSSISRQMIHIIDNHQNEDLFLIMEAIKALGANNEKSCFEFLIDCLNRGELSRYWDEIETSLQWLGSGSELIPKSVFGIDYSKMEPSEIRALDEKQEHELRMERDYWIKVSSSFPQSREDWLARDAGSVFWQKRFKCAMNAPAEDDSMSPLAKLRRDEVPAVRIAAGGRGAEK